jgi:dienelactone hydrolase
MQILTGDWHVNANGFRQTFSQFDDLTGDGRQFEFRRSGGGITQWYSVTVEDGIMIGRFSHSADAAKPTDPLAYKYHITGWNGQAFPTTPAVFDIDANGFRARLRVDKSGDSFVGRYKIYAYRNSPLECAEEEIAVKIWDGQNLAFTRGIQDYTGQVSGRSVSGTFTHAGDSYPWSGNRAEVLAYGLTPKSDEERQAWQERTRRTLYRLMMAGNPVPLSVNVEILADDLPPISGEPHALRDDDPASYPQDYTLTDLRLTYTLPNWMGGEPIKRVNHAYLARPNTPGPHPLVVAVNGHLGSAHKVMDGSTLFWYGDAWARRGYMVLAVDISHRPDADVVRSGSVIDLSTYLGYPDIAYPGDDAAHGNGLRASIKPIDDPYYTDWEEDGERVWDVMRAIDYAVSRSDVDAGRIVVTGLSLGGEVAAYVGALDPRVAVTIPSSGPAADLSVFKYLRRVGHCVNWSFADIREYISQSDVLALTAPRPVIIQTGAIDRTYSEFSIPFAGDKQVVGRARAAGGEVVHFLHPLGHEYRAGVVTHTINDEQTNGETASDGRTVFDYVKEWLGL